MKPSGFSWSLHKPHYMTFNFMQSFLHFHPRVTLFYHCIKSSLWGTCLFASLKSPGIQVLILFCFFKFDIYFLFCNSHQLSFFTGQKVLSPFVAWKENTPCQSKSSSAQKTEGTQLKGWVYTTH